MGLISFFVPLTNDYFCAEGDTTCAQTTYGSGWSNIGGSMIMLIFWLLVIAGIIFLARYLVRRQENGDHHHHHEEKTALGILHERYAKGEINKEEYENKKKDILGQ